MTTAIVSGLIGLLGVLLGIYLNERFRQKSRIEYYSQAMFEKRLIAHQDIYNLIAKDFNNFYSLIDTSAPKSPPAFTLFLDIINNLSVFSGKYALLFNFSIIKSASLLYANALETAWTYDVNEKRNKKKALKKDLDSLLIFIINESGASEINKHFRIISKTESTPNISQFLEDQIAEIRKRFPKIKKN